MVSDGFRCFQGCKNQAFARDFLQIMLRGGAKDLKTQEGKAREQNDAKGTRNKISGRAVNLDKQNGGQESKAKRSRAKPDEAKPSESEQNDAGVGGVEKQRRPRFKV